MRTRLHKASFASVFLQTALLASATGAAELRITDIKAYLFLERAGRLSDNVLDGGPFVNVPQGGALGGDTATGVMIDLTFEGQKNAAPKYATATVDLTQGGAGGRQTVTHKAFANFLFGPDGVQHKAIFLDGATCAPLIIDVRAGKTTKSARLDFQCDRVPAAN